MSQDLGIFFLTCQDPRIHRAVEEFIQQAGNPPRNVIVGASQAVIDPTTRPAFFKGVRLALQFGQIIRRIDIVDHTDCLAYRAEIGTEDEVRFHTRILREAAAILLREFPNIAVRGRLLDTKTGRVQTLVTLYPERVERKSA